MRQAVRGLRCVMGDKVSLWWRTCSRNDGTSARRDFEKRIPSAVLQPGCAGFRNRESSIFQLLHWPHSLSMFEDSWPPNRIEATQGGTLTFRAPSATRNSPFSQSVEHSKDVNFSVWDECTVDLISKCSACLDYHRPTCRHATIELPIPPYPR